MKRSAISFFLDRVAAPLPSFALCTSEGCVLSSSALEPAEAGLLPLAIETVEKYMPPAPGDVVLIKDPFSGGPGRDRVALITAWSAGNDGENKWLAATTVRHPALDKIRLPPVPLLQKGEFNEAVLDGLGAARESLLRAHDQLKAAHELFQRPGIRENFTRPALREITRREQVRISAWLAELPDGDAAVELPLPTGETLRMHWHCDGHRLAIDLSGTSNSYQLRVPFAATCGLLWTTLRDRLGLTAVVDSFSSDVLPLTIPNGCFLNATTGDCDRGLAEITPWIQWAVELLIHKWDRRKARGLVNPFDLAARFKFDPEKILEFTLPTGSPAMAEADGTSFWCQRRGQIPLALEGLERNWPLRVLRIEENAASATPTKFSGGQGLQLKLEVLGSAQFYWTGGLPPKAKIEKHQCYPLFGEVRLLRNNETIVLAPFQELELRAGDHLTLLSGSGGGLL